MLKKHPKPHSISMFHSVSTEIKTSKDKKKVI